MQNIIEAIERDIAFLQKEKKIYDSKDMDFYYINGQLDAYRVCLSLIKEQERKKQNEVW